MRTIALLFFLALSISLFGQYDGQKHAFAFRFMFNDYNYPISNDIIRDDIAGAFEIAYSRALSNGLNIEFPLRVGDAKFPLNEMNDLEKRTFASLDALLRLQLFKEPNFIVPSVFAGVGGVWEIFQEFGFEAPLGVGIDFRLNQHIYLTTKGEYRIGFDDLRDNIQAGAGIKVFFGAPLPPPVPKVPPIIDSDNDGIADEFDACPEEAGLSKFSGCPDKDEDGIADKDDDCPDEAGTFRFRGCPDTDGDGIADKDDDCPNEAGIPAKNGCPQTDADGDGVFDDEDECPNVPGLRNLNGCPDGDGDNVPDKDDLCPEVQGPLATNGCPDTDNDGIVDKDDGCPDRPGPVTNNGCPEIKKEDKEVLEFATQAIQFRTGSSTIASSSYQIMDQIADILKRYPNYNASIDGYTDSVGSASTNQRLSERRAKACFDYLVAKGIDPDRMKYNGYGEASPIADNNTSAGREQNRRVEFNVFLEK